MDMHINRRDLLRLAGSAGLIAALPSLSSTATDSPQVFTDRGYYITFMRMPTYGLAQWKQIIDCIQQDGGNLLLLWMAGAFRSRKFPITWKFNQEHQNVRADFGRELIDYAHTRGIGVTSVMGLNQRSR